MRQGLYCSRCKDNNVYALVDCEGCRKQMCPACRSEHNCVALPLKQRLKKWWKG